MEPREDGADQPLDLPEKGSDERSARPEDDPEKGKKEERGRVSVCPLELAGRAQLACRVEDAWDEHVKRERAWLWF